MGTAGQATFMWVLWLVPSCQCHRSESYLTKFSLLRWCESNEYSSGCPGTPYWNHFWVTRLLNSYGSEFSAWRLILRTQKLMNLVKTLKISWGKSFLRKGTLEQHGQEEGFLDICLQLAQRWSKGKAYLVCWESEREPKDCPLLLLGCGIFSGTSVKEIIEHYWF